MYDTSVSSGDEIITPDEVLPPPSYNGREDTARKTLRETIAFRVTPEQMIAAKALASTFPRGSMSEAMQWVLSSAEGLELIGRRVRGEI